ncbi:hypothetical protein WA577_006615 [Blastocystis sp. JDR]
MALEFLTKKRWNPSNVKNREKVWLREQEVEKEKKKIAELQKQIQQSRQRMELRKLQSGEDDKEYETDRKVGWLYDTGMNSKQKEEDMLLGKVAIDLNKEEKSQLQELEEKKVAGSLFVGDDDLNNPNEVMRRVNEDPLMKMRKYEMDVTKNRLANSQKILKIAALLKEKGSDISVDFSASKKEDGLSNHGRATFHEGVQNEESDYSDYSSESDNFTEQLRRKRSAPGTKKPLRRRSRSSRSTSHRRHYHSRSRHHHHRSSRRSPSRSASRHSRRESSRHAHRHSRSRSTSRSRRSHRSEKRQEQTKKMSNEEVEARLRQMREDAKTEESERSRRLEEDERYYKEESKKVAPVFLSKMGQEAFGDGSISLQDRISSRRHYSTRD